MIVLLSLIIFFLMFQGFALIIEGISNVFTLKDSALKG
jgi:hypothetical protein